MLHVDLLSECRPEYWWPVEARRHYRARLGNSAVTVIVGSTKPMYLESSFLRAMYRSRVRATDNASTTVNTLASSEEATRSGKSHYSAWKNVIVGFPPDVVQMRSNPLYRAASISDFRTFLDTSRRTHESFRKRSLSTLDSVQLHHEGGEEKSPNGEREDDGATKGHHKKGFLRNITRYFKRQFRSNHGGLVEHSDSVGSQSSGILKPIDSSAVAVTAETTVSPSKARTVTTTTTMKKASEEGSHSKGLFPIKQKKVETTNGGGNKHNLLHRIQNSLHSGGSNTTTTETDVPLEGESRAGEFDGECAGQLKQDTGPHRGVTRRCRSGYLLLEEEVLGCEMEVELALKDKKDRPAGVVIVRYFLLSRKQPQSQTSEAVSMVLFISKIHAKGLRTVDLMGKNDAFLDLSFGFDKDCGKKSSSLWSLRTKTKSEGSSEVVWTYETDDADTNFEVSSTQLQEMELTVFAMDHNDILSDSFIGKASISLNPPASSASDDSPEVNREIDFGNRLVWVQLSSNQLRVYGKRRKFEAEDTHEEEKGNYTASQLPLLIADLEGAICRFALTHEGLEVRYKDLMGRENAVSFIGRYPSECRDWVTALTIDTAAEMEQPN